MVIYISIVDKSNCLYTNMRNDNANNSYNIQKIKCMILKTGSNKSKYL